MLDSVCHNGKQLSPSKRIGRCAWDKSKTIFLRTAKNNINSIKNNSTTEVFLILYVCVWLWVSVYMHAHVCIQYMYDSKYTVYIHISCVCVYLLQLAELCSHIFWSMVSAYKYNSEVIPITIPLLELMEDSLQNLHHMTYAYGWTFVQ